MELKVYNNAQLGKIRGCIVNDQVWFVGKDVALLLGYKNTRKALTDHVDADDRKGNESLPLMKGQRYTMINESGLYSLLLRSNQPQARQFKQWVTAEVLPQIRRTGAYSMKHMEQTCRRLKGENAQLSQKAAYTDRVLMSIDCVTTTQVAKEVGLNAQQLNNLLVATGVQYHQCGQYLLCAPYAKLGLAKNRTLSFQDEHGHTRTRTYLVWTELGRTFLHAILER